MPTMPFWRPTPYNPPQTQSSSNLRSHRVRTGETVGSIATQYGIGTQELLSMNPDMKFVNAGMVINIPGTQKPQQAFGAGPGGKPSGWTPATNNWIPGLISGIANATKNYLSYNPNQGWSQIANPSSTTNAQQQAAQQTTLPSLYQQVAQNYHWGATNVIPTATNTQPAAGMGAPEILAGYQASAATAAGKSYNLPSGLSQKQIDEYAGYVEWAARDPNRTINTYEDYLNAKYSGGGGDFWGYMREMQAGQQNGGQDWRQQQREHEMKLLVQSGTRFNAKGRAKSSGRGNNYEQVGVPNNYYRDQSPYQYYSPNSFGVVTWRGY